MFGMVLIAAVTIAQSSAGCKGADPAISSVRVQSTTPSGALNLYHLSGTVTNLGKTKQASNVLQFVDIFYNSVKVDAKGVPPLAPGQHYTFGYDYKRSVDARTGTSHFRFQLDFKQPSSPGAQNCNPSNDVFRLDV